MTKPQLYYRLTGTEEPRFITPREEIIITKCLEIINDLESPSYPVGPEVGKSINTDIIPNE